MKKKKQRKEDKRIKINLTKVSLAIGLLLIVSIGVTYAYFTANITGSESSTTITVGSGTMTITYAGGSAITANNITPRGLAASATPADAWVNKSFTITGNNTTANVMKYKVSLVVLTNTFAAGSLEYKMSATNTGNNGTIMTAITAFTDIASGASTILLGNGQFAAATGGNKVHTYQLDIYFLDTQTDQNTQQGKSFTGYLKTEAVQ